MYMYMYVHYLPASIVSRVTTPVAEENLPMKAL